MQNLKLFMSKIANGLPLLTAMAGVGAFIWPEIWVFLAPWISMKWLFALTMFGIGMTVDPKDFTPIIKKPWMVGLGLMAQFIIMPGLAYLIGTIAGLKGALFLGLILTGCTPGAMASNVIVYLARGDVAFSVSLTTVASLLAPVLTPALTVALTGQGLSAPFWPMFQSILWMVVIPMTVGIGLQRLAPKFATRTRDIFPALSTLCIVWICSSIIAQNVETLKQSSILLFGLVAILNFGGYGLGYLAALGFRFDFRRRKTLALEIGMQNAGLGAALATTHYDSETALIPALFATWCVLTAALLARWRVKSEGELEVADPSNV